MVQKFAVYYNIIMILWPIASLASAQFTDNLAKPDCNNTCGSLGIPYPFGMNDPNCYADKWFEIECRNVSGDEQPFHFSGDEQPFLKLINVSVGYISSSDSYIYVGNPIQRMNCREDQPKGNVVDLRGSPFVYSQRNTFYAIGCNSLALLNSNGSEVGGCVSICDNGGEDANSATIDGCHGRYCCETSLPKYLSEFNTTFQVLTENGVDVSNGQCNYAMISLSSYISQSTEDDTQSVAIFEWEITNSSVQLPQSSNCYPSNITSSDKKSSGRRCQCSYGFDGNPYILGGCTAIPDFSNKKSRAKWAIVGVFSSLGSILLLLGVWWLYKIVRKRMIEKRKEKNFKENGGLLLQQRLSSGEVNVEKTKLFSLKDLEKATDHFNVNRVLGKGGQGTVYKGMLSDGKIVAVKKFKVQGKVEEFINEVVILSQINHRHVVKLLGCCLETEVPLLVYEFIPNGTLSEYLHEQNEDLPMTWGIRLRIATEIAGALFYLHSAASQPIYHRDIKSANILLDEKFKAKVADFGTSRMISIEATHLTTLVQGTFGYLDPEYFHTSQFTDKSDVYSFGVVLIELLTGQKPISSLRGEEAKSLASYFNICMEENRLFDIVDDRVVKEGEKEHIMEVAILAERCINLNGKTRPTMKEVTMELERTQNVGKKSTVHPNHEEIVLPQIEDYQPWLADSATRSIEESRSSCSIEILPIRSTF